jgi:CheY-like chemotaxis protein
MMRTAVILAVEDNPDDVLLLHRAFEKAGFAARIIDVPSGAEALRCLKREGPYADYKKYPSPDLVLLDLAMPGLSGFEVLEWARQQPQFRALPIIILTTSSYGPEIQQSYQLGANSFLTKPVDFDEFVAAVRTTADYWLMRSQLPSPIVPIVPPPPEASA